jgi:hypothetical protein
MPNRRPLLGFAFLVLLGGCTANSSTSVGGSDAASALHHDAGVTKDAGSRESGRLSDAAPPKDGQSIAAWTFKPSVTVAELTQNNTSACGSGSAPCSGPWSQTHTVKYSSGSMSGVTNTVTGFWDNLVANGAQAPGSAYGRVSKVPMSALLAGYDVPVWVETQNWWGPGTGHIDNGETSSSATQIANQVADHVSRGIAGQVVDWYGPGTSADLALPFILSNAEATGGKYEFAVMIDKGYFDTCGTTVACLNSALSYIVAHYGGSSAYLKDPSGHPLIFFFINEYYPAQYALFSESGIDDDGTRFVMYEPNGFAGQDAPNTVGEYAWVNPSDTSYVTSSGPQGSFAFAPDFGFKDLTGFFQNAEKNSGSMVVSAAYKGFDDNLASWSGDRIIDQQCGVTWLQSFQHTGSFAGSASYLGNVNYLALGQHLDMVMVDTWDDYEEGTEIETGIDNCLSALKISLENATLSVEPTWGEDAMNSAVSGSEATLFKYAVYLAREGTTELMWLADLTCKDGSCEHSIDLSGLGIVGGPYVFYVQAVGQPSIVSTLGGPTVTTYTRSASDTP